MLAEQLRGSCRNDLQPRSLCERMLHISRIQPGQSAALRIDALDGRTFQGRVRVVAPQPEITATGDHAYPVVIDFAGPVTGPRTGMTVRITFVE